jgi:competence protein ComEA
MRRVSMLSTLALILLLGLSDSPAAAQAKTAKPKGPSPTATPLNLNTATTAELQALPGVGAATAKLIVEHRQKNGGFKKIEELMNIKGIGEKTFLKLKPMVTVAPEKSDRQSSGDRHL